MDGTPTPAHVPVEQVVALLRAARDAPGRRVEIGQEAAALWWQLDDAGLCGSGDPEPWEDALLGLAAWHTDDDRLRHQRVDDAEIAALLDRLAG